MKDCDISTIAATVINEIYSGLYGYTDHQLQLPNIILEKAMQDCTHGWIEEQGRKRTLEEIVEFAQAHIPLIVTAIEKLNKETWDAPAEEDIPDFCDIDAMLDKEKRILKIAAPVQDRVANMAIELGE